MDVGKLKNIKNETPEYYPQVVSHLSHFRLKHPDREALWDSPEKPLISP